MGTESPGDLASPANLRAFVDATSDMTGASTNTVLDAMAAARGSSFAQLIVSIDRARAGRPLASACRIAALAFAQRLQS